jgi:N-acetylglucosamine kinase-like BadF-type ATPase
VHQAAADGDSVGREIVVRGAHALAVLVHAVRRHLPWEGDIPVAPAGGMWHSTVLYEAFVAALRELDPRMVVRAMAFPPSVGAFLLALQAAGSPVSLESVRASWEAVEHVRH